MLKKKIDLEIQQFQADLLQSARDMKAGRTGRVHRVDAYSCCKSPHQIWPVTNRLCRTTRRLNQNPAKLGTRPYAAQRRSQYSNQSSDAFAKSVGKGYGCSLISTFN